MKSVKLFLYSLILALAAIAGTTALAGEKFFMAAPATDGITSASESTLRARLYPDQPDTFYVLPGEHFETQYGVESVNGHNIYAVNAYFDLGEFKRNSKEFMFEMSGQYSYGDTTSVFSHEIYDDGINYYGRLKWLPNYSSATPIWFWLWYLYGDAQLEEGQVARATFIATIGNSVGNVSSDSKNQYLVGIDGICGDINRDGIVDGTDVEIGLSKIGEESVFDWEGRFTKDGINYGLGRVLFSQPDIVSLAFINIWVHNPSDPLVNNLGIGELMSQRQDRMISTDHYETMVGDNLSITTEGFAVRVSTTLSDGKSWSNASLTKNGRANFKVPDPSLQYHVEAVSKVSDATGIKEAGTEVPDGFILNQNYPNPFNPTTTISYAVSGNGPVTLKVYDLLGKEVATLVNGNKPAGNHTATFDAGTLVSGTYIYRLTANGKTVTKKMILMK